MNRYYEALIREWENQAPVAPGYLKGIFTNPDIADEELSRHKDELRRFFGAGAAGRLIKFIRREGGL